MGNVRGPVPKVFSIEIIIVVCKIYPIISKDYGMLDPIVDILNLRLPICKSLLLKESFFYLLRPNGWH